MIKNQQLTAGEISKIRLLGDLEIVMLVSDINDHGWEMARRTLRLMPISKRVISEAERAALAARVNLGGNGSN